MNKYINASEAEMIIESEAENLAGEGLNVSASRLWKLQNKIRDLPSADVVEVVRCKDCKHFVETGGTLKNCFLFQGMTNPKSDDFCSYGEWKDDE